VILDYQTANQQILAVATWAGSGPSEYFGTYYTSKGEAKTLIYRHTIVLSPRDCTASMVGPS